MKRGLGSRLAALEPADAISYRRDGRSHGVRSNGIKILLGREILVIGLSYVVG